jgi:uncharacterized iron-regulated membrane protein
MTRKILFWTHLSIGVVAGVAIFIMSATGVLLAFERQMLHLVDRELRTVSAPQDAAPRRLGEMLAAVSATAGSTPSGVVIRPNPSASVEFTFGRDRNVYVDPYTGAVLGEGSRPAREFFATVERWHRTLGEPLRARGPLRAGAAAANLLFLVLMATGLYLWLARRWSWAALRSTLLPRVGLRGHARDWNWHHAVGVWCAPPLLLIILTGVIISYPWANAGLFRLAGSAVPTRQEAGRPPRRDSADPAQGASQALAADLDRAVAVARARLSDWRSMTLRVPAPGETAVAVSLDAGTGGEVEKRTELLVDTRSGLVLRVTRFRDNPLAQRLRALVRFVHTGEEGGLAGQLVAAVASAGGGLLVWTGLSLALRRLRAARRDGPLQRGLGDRLWLLALWAFTVSVAVADEGASAGPTDRSSVKAPVSAPQGAAAPFRPPTFADDTLRYVYGPHYRNPFITTPEQPDGADIARNAIELKHVDAWKYGHNLVEVIIKKSSDIEPAAGGGTGALGLYAIFRSGVGINRIARKPIISLGPLRDIDIQAGMNLETKSTDYAPQERTLYLGPNLQFRFGSGFLNVGLQLRKEWNHNGNLGKNESYDVDFNIEPVWHFPFRVGGAQLAFDGYADYNTPKGKDAAGRQTRAEFITRPLLKLDISPVVGRKSGVLELAVGFEYWHNMFGKDANRVPGAKQLTPVFSLAVHLPLGGSGH